MSNRHKSGRTLSAHTIEQLKAVLAHQQAATAAVQRLLDAHDAALADAANEVKLAMLVRQWQGALH